MVSADVGDGNANLGNSDALVPYNDLGLTLGEVLDPWGMRYRYQPNSLVINTGAGFGISTSTPASNTVAMTIFSQGPNRADGGGDDISISVTVNELRGYMSAQLP